MESWENGRLDLFTELSKVCDGIGQNIVAGAWLLF
jgi:hypothetical protein